MNAVNYQDDRPLLELAAEEWIFPVLTANEQFKLLFHMRPYRAYEVKKFYDVMSLRRRSRGGQERVLEIPDQSEAKQFFDEHFLKLGGVELENGEEPSPEQQREWINSHADIKVSVFRQGYDGIRNLELNGNGHVPRRLTLLLDSADQKVSCRWRIHSPERKTDEELILLHHLGRLTQADRSLYTKAMRFVENTRTNEQYLEGNWDIVEQLYDSKIKRLEGAVVDGRPCTEENREGWKPLVPFCLKNFVMSAAMEEVDLKNA